MNRHEINALAVQFKTLKNQAEETGDYKEFNKFQNYCVNKLKTLVTSKTFRYRNYSNYSDLCQDGFEALVHSFDTYDIKKGDFLWWANKYVATRVYRCANAHSTIKVPLKKAKNHKPWKMLETDVVETGKSSEEIIEIMADRMKIAEAIEQLPDKEKKVLCMYYGFDYVGNTMTDIVNEMNISRPSCMKLLKKAESNLKLALENRI